MKKELSPARKIEMVIELIESGNSIEAHSLVKSWARDMKEEFICHELTPFLRNEERKYWMEYEPMLSDLKEALAKAGGSEITPLHATIEAQRQRIAELEALEKQVVELEDGIATIANLLRAGIQDTQNHRETYQIANTLEFFLKMLVALPFATVPFATGDNHE